MTARFTVKPESVDLCKEAIAEFVDHVTRNEPDTRMYVSMQNAETHTEFLHVFIFEDEAAEEHHANSEAVQKFTSILYPECLAPVEFTPYLLVASTEE
jgi:quinol monooxygenase YgiN